MNFKTAYIVLFVVIVGVLGSLYMYRVNQTLNYIENEGKMPVVTEQSYSYENLYGDRQPTTPATTINDSTEVEIETNTNAAGENK